MFTLSTNDIEHEAVPGYRIAREVVPFWPINPGANYLQMLRMNALSLGLIHLPDVSIITWVMIRLKLGFYPMVCTQGLDRFIIGSCLKILILEV